MTGKDQHEAPDFADLSARVYRLCMGLLGRETDALDAAQESLARAWSQRDRKRPHVKWWTWTGGFAVRVCREMYRDRLRDRADLSEPPSEIIDRGLEAGDIGADQRVVQLHASILQLPERQREVVILRLVMNRSTEESAAVLGCPAGTVKSNLHKAVQRLHAMTALMNSTDEL